MADYPDFADFAEESKSFDGDKKKLSEILDRHILIVDFKVKPSKQNKGTFYTTIQFKIDGVNYIIFTGSNVLTEQLEKYKSNLPFYATIKKIDKYYTFT